MGNFSLNGLPYLSDTVITVSSADWCWRKFLDCLCYRPKRIGPRMVPCGIRVTIFWKLDLQLIITTHSSQFSMIETKTKSVLWNEKRRALKWSCYGSQCWRPLLNQGIQHPQHFLYQVIVLSVPVKSMCLFQFVWSQRF